MEGLEYASLIGAARLLVLAALSGGACVWDLRVRRIPNALTFPAAAAGLALALAEGGWPGGGWSLAGLLAGGEIQLRSVTATVEGGMDIQGILGMDSDVRNGFDGIKVTYTIDADATPDEIKAIVAQSQKRSAVFDALTNPTNVTVEVN